MPALSTAAMARELKAVASNPLNAQMMRSGSGPNLSEMTPAAVVGTNEHNIGGTIGLDRLGDVVGERFQLVLTVGRNGRQIGFNFRPIVIEYLERLGLNRLVHHKHG